ncbi:MAG: M20/M25/M40 family metallo-hydrolase [Bacteroidetes bacterium]|nr:MAG: M20/M25/M40 family metallo-hydrolase [Bacteroidota bacterium]
MTDHPYLAQLHQQACELLQQLIATPSLSREEGATADLIAAFLAGQGVPARRKGHNVWAQNAYAREQQPLILLNSHHDTVRPGQGWESDPFTPTLQGDRLTGLGSNDAGGPLVALLATFLYFYKRRDLPFRLVMAATAEEEISGKHGVASILPELGPVHLGVVGEPTGMQMAIAEKGLMVLDVTARGRTGHAARNEGLNAIYEALPDIEWLRTYRFDKVSPLLGEVKMTVTQIQAGTQHNVVPDNCTFVVDVRSTEQYTNRELFDLIAQHLKSEVKARSFRLNSSGISLRHPIVQRGLQLGLSYFGSPTLSDQALMPFTTLKIGPGDSARSHTPNEYILLSEIRQGIETYIQLLEGLELEEG